MIKSKISKILCGVVAVAIAGTFSASAANLVTELDAATLNEAKGSHTTDMYDNLLFKHNPANKSDHSLHGLEPKDANGNHIAYDGSKSYTIVVEARYDSYYNDEEGQKATDPDARVFAIDNKYRNAADRDTDLEQDPVEGWFRVNQIENNPNVDDEGFGQYYVVVTPENAYYEAIDKINIEYRLRYMAAADDMYMNIAIRSIKVYEGEIAIPGGVRSLDNLPKTDDEDAGVKPGTSYYGTKGQKAKYKGSNKDFVNGDFDNNSYKADKNTGKTETVNTDNTNTDVSNGSESVDYIPQAGSEGAGMIVLAMVAAAAIGGTAFIAGKKRK